MASPMNESEFNDIVDDLLVSIEDAIEAACDETGVDIDYETSGGILNLTFANGSKIIINRQTPLKQIWLATQQGGFHFDYNAASDKWLCQDKDLENALSEYCSDQAGQPVTLNF
jgi:CyaY protein